MPKAFPPEFRRDVIAVGRRGEALRAQVVRDFGISEACPAHLINAARDIHHDDLEFGYRFIADELATRGIVASRNRVNRLCTSQRIFSVHSRKRGLHRKPGPPVHDDLVERQFTADEPNTLWLTPPYKPVLRPSLEPEQFRSHVHVRALRDHGLVGSMGRVGACADNAAMESFFALLQKNVLDRKRWATRDEAPGDHHLDRADLSPPPSARPPRPAHPRGVRSRATHCSRSMQSVHRRSQSKSGQSRTLPGVAVPTPSEECVCNYRVK